MRWSCDRNQENNKEVIAVNPVRKWSCLNQDSCSGGAKNWLNSTYIFHRKLIGFAHASNVSLS